MLFFSSVLNTVAAVVLALLTGWYVMLTRKILESQSDPHVIFTVKHDKDRPSLLQLVVRNAGNGLARDIRFEFSRPVPSRAFGLDIKETKKRKFDYMTSGPLINGIPALGPGETREIDWGQYAGLRAALGDEPISVICKFKKNTKEMTPTEFILEVDSFAGTTAAESQTHKISGQIEKISQDIGHLASCFEKLVMRIISLPTETDNKDEEIENISQ